MAISEFERKRMEKLVAGFVEKKRPELHIRNQLDLGYRISNQSFELFSLHRVPAVPDSMIEIPVVKATWVKSKKHWKIFWKRSDTKWHVYEPVPTVKRLEEVLDMVEQDAHSCFWG